MRRKVRNVKREVGRREEGVDRCEEGGGRREEGWSEKHVERAAGNVQDKREIAENGGRILKVKKKGFEKRDYE
jgi:hypothetical protein